ncbi:hypothetical protein HHI36_000231 [Cryptolaemus montrouzieri]|uniref:Protein misato n=1 Tax=Cryptolaemus montrouzieri TaxID=559131 RepID=A0ABD2P425_9CUCU
MNFNNCGDILTIQFGHYANCVGTHWWNIQEKSFNYSKNEVQDINHDVLYREGVNEKGQVTFTPRLLLVDLKGSLGALPENSQLYGDVIEPSEAQVEWEPARVDIKEENKLQKNKFQQDLEDEGNSQSVAEYNLENDVKVWSDFLYARFHPRTLNIIKEYQHGNDSLFSIYPMGGDLWKSEQFNEDFVDKIRNYVEESDFLQGFQVLLDSTDGFSGLSTSCIEHLRDEYGKNIIAFPMIPSFYPDYKFQTEEERHQSLIKDSSRVLNLAFCFNNLRENSSLFVPLCTGKNGWRQPGEKRKFYHCEYDPELYYHSGAILASALDTLTLKYRLKHTSYTLRDLSVDLTPQSRIAAAASLCLPFSLNSDAELIDCLDHWEGPLTQTITPNCTLGTDRMIQLYTLRGISEDRLKRPSSKAGTQKDLPAYKCETIREMLEFYLSCTTFTSINNVTVVDSRLNVETPFPKIFDKFVGQKGNIFASPRQPYADVDSVPVMAGLHNGSGVGEMLESLHTQAKRIKFARFHQFKNAGVEMDDYSECLDNLFDFRECYEDNYFI